MGVRPELAQLAGRWKGSYRLHTNWLPEEAYDSATAAKIELRVKDQFLAIDYEWEYDGKKQEGVLIAGCDKASDAVQAVWTDSWHMSHKFLVCDGTIDEAGKVNVKGYYSVPENPDWGWRTEIRPGKDSFEIIMYNVSPEGDETIAVEATYSRE
jgi:hypothetical protein